MRVLLDYNPLAPSNLAPSDFQAAFRARPAWITPPAAGLAPSVTAYRLRFDLPETAVIRAHVSADERYQLFLDGERVGRGPERGSDRIWFFETYDLDLSAGPHLLTALVWQLGDIGPLAQIGLAGGFLLEAEGPFGELISTRTAVWETRPVDGISFSKPQLPGMGTAWFVEPIQTTDGSAYPWGVEKGEGQGWMPAAARREDVAFPFGIQAEHVLHPAMLPAQMAARRQGGRVRHVAEGIWRDEQSVQVDASANLTAEGAAWQALFDGIAPLVVPPRTRRQIILDLEDYVCAYPQILLSGGAGSRVTIGWAEALHLDASGHAKGPRDEIAGRTFIALCRDVVIADGGEKRLFEPLWWRAGRFIELLVESGDEPLTVEAFHLLETRYPLEMESRFNSSDEQLNAVTPVALRGLQMCAHETYMDCPYYEQMMYVGDSRLEALTTYAISADSRLPRKAIHLFGLSRLPDGLTQARYPGRDVQIIPPFSLWWIGMVYDYALWRGDRAFIAGLLPGVRAVLDGFMANVQSNYLLRAPQGWNFSDWVADWPLGVPPDGFDGFSGLLNWHLVYTLGLAVSLEEWAGEGLLAQRWQGLRDRIANAVKAAFWNEPRGLFADDLAHTRFSEHTQCLALLSGVLDGEQRRLTGQNLLNSPDLTRTTIYFNHYLFETYRLLEQPGAFFDRMRLWFDLPAQGFKTTPEQPEPTRSDCHGWGAHPLYHDFASLLGIQPASFGFERVEIAPMPGHLKTLSGTMPHPRGQIDAVFEFEAGHVRGSVSLPAGIYGTFRFAGKTVNLQPGAQSIAL